MEAIVSSPSLVGASRPPAGRLSEDEGMHTHVRVDDDAGTGDLARRATGRHARRHLLGYCSDI